MMSNSMLSIPTFEVRMCFKSACAPSLGIARLSKKPVIEVPDSQDNVFGTIAFSLHRLVSHRLRHCRLVELSDRDFVRLRQCLRIPLLIDKTAL